jgi:hypothetical protein
MFGLSGFNLSSPHYNNSASFLGIVLLLPETSWHDPATYSFAHGGKDGYPYPVDCDTYDQTIEVLRDAIEGAERYLAIRRLGEFV